MKNFLNIKFFIKLFLFSILIIKASLADIQKPRTNIEPEQVILIQLSALMKNDNPYKDRGIIQTWEFAENLDYDRDVTSASYETTSVYGFGHPLYYRNLIDVMRGFAEPETDGREGLKSLEFLTAAYLAARDGISVGLPLDF